MPSKKQKYCSVCRKPMSGKTAIDRHIKVFHPETWVLTRNQVDEAEPEPQPHPQAEIEPEAEPESDHEPQRPSTSCYRN